jgi:exopolysaccharide production protein ExoQ
VPINQRLDTDHLDRDLRLQTAARVVASEDRRGPRSSALFTGLSEIFLVLAVVKAFGVVGGDFFSRQAQLTQFTCLFGVMVLALAPSGTVAKSRVNLLALATMGWYFITGFWTTNPSAWQDFMFYLVALPVITMVVLGTMPFERIMLTLKRVTYGVIGLIFAAAAVMPSRTTVHAPLGNDQPLPGWHGTFVHKNDMMTFLVIGLITVLVFERDRRARNVAIVLVYVLAILGQSGTGLGVVTLTLLAHASMRQLHRQTGKNREIFLLTVLSAWTVLVVVMLVAGPAIVQFYGKDLTFTGRTDIWSATWTAIGERPWFGYGIGSVWEDFASQPTAGIERAVGFRAAHAHNGALELLIETGIVGLVLWSACFVGAAWACWRVRRVAPEASRWGLLICSAVAQLSVSETTTFRGPWLLIASLGVLMTVAVRQQSRAHTG